MSRTLFTLLLLPAGCSRALAPADLVAWAEDPAHGLVQAAHSGPYTITARYEPAPVRLARELVLGITAASEAEARSPALAEAQAVRLQLAHVDGPQALAQGLSSVAGFNAELCGGLHLETGAQIAPCRLALPEVSGGLTPHLTVLVAFEAARASGADPVLVVDLSPPLEGPVRLRFPAASIDALPPLEVAP